MSSIFSKVRFLQVGERIVDERGGASLSFQRLWQQLIGNPEYLEGSKADKTTMIIAGAGLTGGGDLSEDRTFDVGAGTGIIVNADDVAIDLTAEAERIRDVMGVALVAGSGVMITPNDGADTITIAATGSFSSEDAQDAVGNILVDTSTINFTYTDATPEITADVVAGSIGPTQLESTAVMAGTYGDSTHVAQFTVDQDGRLTFADEVAISGGGGSGSWIPMVDGSEPPVFITDGAGTLILVAGP